MTRSPPLVPLTAPRQLSIGFDSIARITRSTSLRKRTNSSCRCCCMHRLMTVPSSTLSAVNSIVIRGDCSIVDHGAATAGLIPSLSDQNLWEACHSPDSPPFSSRTPALWVLIRETWYKVSGCEASLAASAMRRALVASQGPARPCGLALARSGAALRRSATTWSGVWPSSTRWRRAVVGGVEAAQQLLERAMRVDGDAEHFGADATVEALDHAIRLGRAGAGVPILRAEGHAGLGEGRREAAAIVGQHVDEPKGEGRRGFPEEGDGAGLGLVVLDREVHEAGPAVDGDVEVALAPLAVGGLQLGQVLMSMCTKPRS